MNFNTKSTAGLCLAVLFNFGLVSCKTESLTPVQTNHPPHIYDLQMTPGDTVEIGDTLTLRCNADDPDGDSLGYLWAFWNGSFTVDPYPPDSLTSIQDSAKPFIMRWPVHEPEGLVVWMVTINDGWHNVSSYDTVTVVPWGFINDGPRIDALWADKDTVLINDTVRVYCEASDPNDDALTYEWSVSDGLIQEYFNQAVWTAPGQAGRCSIEITVSDGSDIAQAELSLVVKEPDTLVFYRADYSEDQVTDYWEYVGLLTGLGEVTGARSINWDRDQQAMAVIGRSDFGMHSFRLKNYRFGEGTFSVDIKALSSQFGGIGFLPKFKDLRNYLLVTINFFQPQYLIFQCVDGQTTWIQSEWIQYDLAVYHTLTYTLSGSEYSVSIDGDEKYRGSVPQVFRQDASVGVAVYDRADSGPAFFDNLSITKP